jgi:AraC-like DNA-binding protein
LWNQRLDMARTWLVSADRRDVPISEIAYGVGFKSPAHFSRMFKRVYNQNPRDYRATTIKTTAPFSAAHEDSTATLQ